jgi:hypothetical protein
LAGNGLVQGPRFAGGFAELVRVALARDPALAAEIAREG